MANKVWKIEGKKLGKSFYHAFRGVYRTFLTEQTFRFHTIATVLVIIAMIYFHLKLLECAILFLAIGLVLSAEMLNTAIERTLDHLNPDIHPSVEWVKDMVAGAVFISAIFALIIGICVFLPHIQNLSK